MSDFLNMLNKHGGYIIVTDEYTKDDDLLSMVIDCNVIYPCFQFSNEGFGKQIDGFSDLLQLITTKVSNVRKANFFMSQFNDSETIYQVLRRGADIEEWYVLSMLAKNFGTNNLT